MVAYPDGLGLLSRLFELYMYVVDESELTLDLCLSVKDTPDAYDLVGSFLPVVETCKVAGDVKESQ